MVIACEIGGIIEESEVVDGVTLITKFQLESVSMSYSINERL